jgi:hypothetical protein
MVLNTNEAKILNQQLNLIFVELNYKVNFNLSNNSSYLLPTDLLRDNIKKHLYKVVSLKVEKLIYSVLLKNGKFDERATEKIFYFLLKSSTEELLNFYFGSHFKINTLRFKNLFYINALATENKVIFTTTLSFLTSANLTLFGSVFYPVYKFTSNTFVAALVDNFIVGITNCVIFYVINELSYLCDVRKMLFRSNFLSLRNLERFKNNLNWQARVKSYFTYPRDTYNNEYNLWVIRTTGVYNRIIYANRSNELKDLTNLSSTTILIIEAKDFLSSRVDEIFYNTGNSIRYTLTSVIGQFVALLWRGIIEGLKK